MSDEKVEDRLMRVMELPTLTVPDSAEDAVALYRERFHATDRGNLPLICSIRLLSYVTWPNDLKSQSGWAAATLARQQTLKAKVSVESIPGFDLLGGLGAISDVAFDRLNDDLTKIMKGWPPVADVMSRLADMAHDERADLRGGSSISKALALSDFDPEGRSRSQTERLWSRFRDVAHIIAAGAVLAASGTHPNSKSLFSAMWFAPDAVASIAAGFEDFGLSTIPHGQVDPLLPPATSWRLPEGCRPKSPFLVTRKLTDEQLSFLNQLRSSKPYQSKPE